jgi:hypothetical protein
MAISDNQAVLHDIKTDTSMLEVGTTAALTTDHEGYSAVVSHEPNQQARKGIKL